MKLATTRLTCIYEALHKVGIQFRRPASLLWFKMFLKSLAVRASILLLYSGFIIYTILQFTIPRYVHLVDKVSYIDPRNKYI